MGRGDPPAGRPARYAIPQRKCLGGFAARGVYLQASRCGGHATPSRLPRDPFRQAFRLELPRMRHGHEATVDDQPAGALDPDIERGQPVLKRRRPDYPGVEVGDGIVDEGGTRGLGEDVRTTMPFASHQAVGARSLLRRSLADLEVERLIDEIPEGQGFVDARTADLTVRHRQVVFRQGEPCGRPLQK